MRTSFAVALLLVAALPQPSVAHASPVAAAPSFQLEPCRVPGLDEEVRCGTYEVFEDRAAASGRKIPLHVVVLPATGGEREPDPLVFFAGGPGGAATDQAAGLSAFFSEARARRDILLVDVRGTGKSAPLTCPYQEEERGVQDVLETFIPTARLPECKALLEQKADLTKYTTPFIVDDVDEVRRALGYPRVDLFGGSYGTRAALEYLRRHPDAVRTAVLEGVAPSYIAMPTTFARDAQTALDGVYAECAADPACHAAFPDPAAELAAVLAAVERQPVTVDVVDAKSGQTVALTVSRNVLVQTLRYMLYDALKALQVPLYVHLAAQGNYGPLAQVAYSVAGSLMVGIPDGLYLSVTCVEDIARVDRQKAEKLDQGTFLGDFRLKQQLAACDGWPLGELPPGYFEPVSSSVPVLILSGERDPVTPARWGDEVARHLPNSRHLVVPDGGHGSFGLPGAECADRLVVELVESGSVAGLDLEGCRRAVHRPPFPLELVADVEVELTAAELDRLVGSYQVKGMELRIERTGDHLDSVFGEDRAALVPLSPTRFALKGGQPGTYLEFELADERPVAVVYLSAGTSVMRFERKE